MEVLNYTGFRRKLSKKLDMVCDDAETVIVSRGKGRNVVVISLVEYNSMMETMHLMGTEANRKRLQEAIDEMKSGKYQSNKLIDG